MFPTIIVDLSTLLFSSNLIASLKKYLKKWIWYMKHIIYVLNLRYQAVWGQCFMRKGDKWDESCRCSSFLPEEKFKAIVREGELRCNQTQKLKHGYPMNDERKAIRRKELEPLGWGGVQDWLWRKWVFTWDLVANVRGVEIAHGGDIRKYYKSGTAQPSFIKKIKVCGGDL